MAKVAKWVLGTVAVLYGLLWLFHDHGPFPLFRPMPSELAARQPALPSEQPRIQTPAAVDMPSPGDRIRPEDLIRFPNSAALCASEDALKNVMRHGLLGEARKLNALFATAENANAPCIMISPKRTLKVLSARYPDQQAEVGVIEVVGADSAAVSGGHWAFTVGAVVVNGKEGGNGK